jgi:RNA polymerase sigma-70 factor (ECF subfamily)
MQWETTIPNVLAGDATRRAGAALACAPMDSDEFAGFYERSARPLWAYLARASGDTTLADDLLQESYMRFLCADRNEDGEVAARRYLFKIGTNLLRDHWRRPKASSIDELPEELLHVADQTRQADEKAMLGPALQRMKPRERQLLWLAYAEGYSHREIAEIMGLGSASIRLLLFRARHKIAALLPAQARGRAE